MPRRKSNGHRRNGSGPRIHVYRTYSFVDKDPVIDKMRTIMEDEGVRKDHAALIAGMSPSTTHNWFDGDTRRPQFASIAAFARALGYDLDFKKERGSKLVIEAELEAAAKELADRKKNPTKVPRFVPYRFR